MPKKKTTKNDDEGQSVEVISGANLDISGTDQRDQDVNEIIAVPEILHVTLRTDSGFEYHLEMPRPEAEDIIDPTTPDVRIEVPCPIRGTRRFLHTSYIKEVDVKGL